ncbi:MAG TPA: sensor histidine kinase N-terminal domain-containing protein [Usitatibacter sp.]|nr:sensor histidine kinase N-terminal domain-containing protein [Usitatibacter sp.]
MAPEPRRLRTQLLAWLVVPLVPLLVLDTAFTYWVAAEFSRRAYDRSLMDIARELSLHLRPSPQGTVLDLPEGSRRILLSDSEDRILYEVADLEGRFIDGVSLPAAPAELAAATTSGAFFEASLRDLPVRVVELRVDGDPYGSRPGAVVRVAETQLKRQRFAREILLSVVVPQVAIILLAGTLVWIGVVKGLAPLERLRREIKTRSQSDRRPISAEDVPAEVRPLLDSINELMARLDRALELQNRFISDAAHQLKTPVAVLKTQVEVALREDDPNNIRQALGNARAGLDRLSRVVSQLLSLARNEPDAARATDLVPTDVEALALDVSQGWVPEALKRNIDMGFEGTGGPVTVPGDPARLRVLLDNLIDNAVRYSQENGHITVRVRANPPQVEVADNGPRIPEQESERVFERFYRRLGTTQEGSGLGLAIAREIARVHGATLSLGHDGEGNCFRLAFPARRGNAA